MPEFQLAVRIALSHLPPASSEGPKAPAVSVTFDCACDARMSPQPSTFSHMLRDALRALGDTAPPELHRDAVFPGLWAALQDKLGARMDWRAAEGAGGVTHRAEARDPQVSVEAGFRVLDLAATPAATTIPLVCVPLVCVRLCTEEGTAEAVLVMKTVQHFLCVDGVARMVSRESIARIYQRAVPVEGAHAHRALLQTIFPAQWHDLARASRVSREMGDRVITTPLPNSGVSLVSVYT
jgi:hypothetical protein